MCSTECESCCLDQLLLLLFPVFLPAFSFLYVTQKILSQNQKGEVKVKQDYTILFHNHSITALQFKEFLHTERQKEQLRNVCGFTD